LQVAANPERKSRESLQSPTTRADAADVSPAVVVSLVLLSAPSSSAGVSPPVSPPGVVDLATGAWAVVHAGQLWVCWSEAPACWRRVELEGEVEPVVDVLLVDELTGDAADLGPDPGFIADDLRSGFEAGPERWRLGFSSGRSLWIELDDRRWRVDFGRRRARAVEDPPPARLLRPRPGTCGPNGQQPAVLAGRLDWRAAPRCELPPPAARCVSPPRGERARRPVPVRLRAGLQLSTTRAWSSVDDGPPSSITTSLRPRAGLELALVVELGFDLGAAQARARGRAALLRRASLRSVPAVEPGPLAHAEQRALVAVVCGGRS
jgi:hypothetical protein